MSKTILAVDDESHILQVVSLKLRNAKYTVITSTDPQEALDIVRDIPIDLLITDYQMPGMSGIELARRLRGTVRRSGLPVILLTAHGLALEPVELDQAGVEVFLSKPFSPRELLTHVSSILNKAPSEPTSPSVPSVCS